LKKYINYGNLATFTKQVMYGIDPNTVEKDDLDKELDRKLGKMEVIPKNNGDYLYTKSQMDCFEDVAEHNVDLVKMIMDNMSATNKKVGTNEVLTRTELAFNGLKYKIDYSAHGTGINPDLFIEWVGDHWLEMQDLIEVTIKKEKNKTTTISTVINSAKSGFLPELKNADISGTKYHYDEYQIFSKMVEKHPVVVKMMLVNFEIFNKAEIRDALRKQIWDEISTLDYKRSDKTPLTTYVDKFINWVYEYSEEIRKYLNISKPKENEGRGVRRDDQFEVSNVIYNRLNKYVKDFEGLDYDHNKKEITFKKMDGYTPAQIRQIKDIINALGEDELKDKFIVGYLNDKKTKFKIL